MTAPVIVYTPRHVEHRPQIEILYGRPTPHPEQAERVEAIRSAIATSRWAESILEPQSFPMSLAEVAHDPVYITFLRERASAVADEGLDGEWFPYTWPRDRGLDMGTPVAATTVDDAWRSTECALTASAQVQAGAPWSMSIGRPPGHHASVGAHGGYCYFNHAAIVATTLLTSNAPVAILDLDIHHGNGTQEIFYGSDRVTYASLHGDPSWAYPPHSGFAEERGVGVGHGHTYNQPLPLGTDWAPYDIALDRALDFLAWAGPSHLIVSQGFDTFAGDRWGGFNLHAPDFAKIGARLRSFGLPIIAILEGGYEPANLAAGTLAFIEGLGT